MAEIRLHAVSHSYRSDPPEYVLEDFEMRFVDGGAYALLGPSGCGKTTLLNIISGLITPTRGKVTYGGRDVTQLPPSQRNIAQVFQFPVVYDTMTVYDNLAFPLRNRGVGKSEIHARVEEIAEYLQLSHALGARATGLSADEKQLISLGRGLVRDDVAAILFDEPLTVIDPHRKWQLRRTLRAIHRRFDHTMIYVTHDQTEALTFADEVMVMRDGQVLQMGPPQELFERPAHTYVGYFIGSPGMNLLPCTVPDQEDVAVIAGHAVPLPAGLAALARKGTNGVGALTLGIRPQHVTLAHDPGGHALPLRVRTVADHGRFLMVAGRIDGVGADVDAVAGDGEDYSVTGAVHLALPPGTEVGADSTVAVRFPPERICLYRDHVLLDSGAGAGTAPDVGQESSDPGAGGDAPTE